MRSPSHKTILTVSVALLAGASAVAFLAVKKDSNLPVYNGKNVEEWFYGEDGHPGRQVTFDKARDAFREMGTNCVPYLIEVLKTQDTPLNNLYCKLHRKLPWYVQKRLPHALNSEYLQMISIAHLRDLPIQHLDPFGAELMEIYPILKTEKGINSINYLLIKEVAIRAKDKNAKKSFFLLLLTVPDSSVKLDAAVALSNFAPDEPSGIPILLEAFKDSNFTDYWHKFRTTEAIARMNPGLVEQFWRSSQ